MIKYIYFFIMQTIRYYLVLQWYSNGKLKFFDGIYLLGYCIRHIFRDFGQGGEIRDFCDVFITIDNHIY